MQSRSGLPKKTETLYFFEIKDATKFRKDLTKFIPHIKTTTQVIADRRAIDDYKRTHGGHQHQPQLITMVGVNIAFSHFGFKKVFHSLAGGCCRVNKFVSQLQIDDSKLADPAFLKGQKAQAEVNLADKGTGTGGSFVPDWEENFKRDIDGVILLAGDSHATVNKRLATIEGIFGVGTPQASLTHTTSVIGDARPGDQSAHEQCVVKS